MAEAAIAGKMGSKVSTLRFLAMTLTAAMASPAAEIPSAPLTFNRDVLPILQKHCQTCHRPGEVAPMSLLTYQETRPWARAIKAAVMTQKMPPWPADSRYGHFLNDRSLKPEEVNTIAAWADGGALEGDAKDRPGPLQWRQGWTTQPDVVISLPAVPVP